jgi:hypothetical protein
MKVYRIFDKQLNTFIKIGKRSNDIYVNKPLVESTLQRYYNLKNIDDRFKIIEYDLVRKEKEKY